MATRLSPHPTEPELEARSALLDLARGKFGKIPTEWLADHVLSLHGEEADWPVHRGAMEALVRRFASARRDRLAVAERPARGAPFGAWQTKRPGVGPRGWTTWLDELEPLRGSCDCPDYLRGSLGLCKHLLVAMEDVAKRPRTLARARRGAQEASRPRLLTWDPVRPLSGEGDWMDGLELHLPPRRSATVDRARRLFARGADGRLLLRDAHATDPARRLRLVGRLRDLMGGRGRSSPPDPAVKALLSTEQEHLERVVADSADRGKLLGQLRSLKRKLYPYQRQGVEAFLRTGRLLLADDMGLGKTAQAIAACHGLYRAGRVRRGLLIVPASLKPQWSREWELFTDAPVAVVEGSPEQRAEAYAKMRSGFLIANYEQLLRDADLISRWQPELICLDEAQRIKNWATKTAASVKTLRPPYRLVLTGTPLENRLDELASIMDWVDDRALEPKWRLVPWHARAGDGETGIDGLRNLDTLRRRLQPTFVRRVRKEVLAQLPPRTDTIVPVALTDAQREAHDELALPIMRLMKTSARRPLTQAEFLRLMSLLTTQRIIANGMAQLEFQDTWPDLKDSRPNESRLRRLSSPKLEELRALLESLVIDQGRKVVVFSQWRRMLSLASWAVSDRLAEQGLRSAFFTGAEGARRRTQNIVDFHDDPQMRVLFTSDAGGVGLNLQRAASACINLDLPWNPAVLEQRIGRIYRLGQKRPIDVFNLVGQDSIEERMLGLIGQKKQLFSGLFDGDSDEVRFERSGNFLESVRQVTEPLAEPTEDVEADDEDSPGPSRSDEEALIEAGDESRDEPDSSHRAPASSEIGSLLGQLHVSPRADGGLRIDAPPEAAATLGALFESFGQLLSQAAARDESGDGARPRRTRRRRSRG